MSVCVCVCVCVGVCGCVWVCVGVCGCVREREREAGPLFVRLCEWSVGPLFNKTVLKKDQIDFEGAKIEKTC